MPPSTPQYDEFLMLPGTVVSGHPDRHVLRVEHHGRPGFLKREHRVPWRDRLRNWLAGFGWVSTSLREARTLERLQALGGPVPSWRAVGESGDGRAFLLVDAVAQAVELRQLIYTLPADAVMIRLRLAEQIGAVLGRLHAAGVDHPDVSAKHWLLDRQTLQPTLLDWQRTRLGPVAWSARIKALALLQATLAAEQVSRRERLAGLRAYLRHTTALPPGALRQLLHRVRQLRRRNSVREQQFAPLPTGTQDLVWLDGEALCVRATFLKRNSSIAVRRLCADAAPGAVTLPNGQPATLQRWQTRSLRAWWRGRAFRAPGVRQAATWFAAERRREAGPQVLAFGQRAVGWGAWTSFVLWTAMPEVEHVRRAA
jgi:tRNA A-37 threonylcarbamoyl transferase component Bud32